MAQETMFSFEVIFCTPAGNLPSKGDPVRKWEVSGSLLEMCPGSQFQNGPGH